MRVVFHVEEANVYKKMTQYFSKSLSLSYMHTLTHAHTLLSVKRVLVPRP